MSDARPLRDVLDDQLRAAVDGAPGLPHVVAVVIDGDETAYAGAAGSRTQGEGAPMTLDSVVALFSAGKPLASTVCLQFAEAGHLDLDRPAKDYVPELGSLQVLDGFDPQGQPKLRPPTRDITTRMLLLHTAGFGYDFFDPQYRKLVKDRRHPPTVSGKKTALMTPLLFDPGERWLYGSSIDWVGQILERVTGERLEAVMRNHLFEPLGMASTGFACTSDMRRRLACMHQREGEAVRPLPDYQLPADPEVYMAGHGLYSTAPDFARFIKMWLSDGRGPRGPILRPETVAMASQDGLSGKKIQKLTSTNARVTHDFEPFGAMPKSWALSFMVNDQRAPTGRTAGSLAWAGLGNLYFWIDRKKSLGGFWATQLFPFGDEMALDASLSFEKTVYDYIGR